MCLNLHPQTNETHKSYGAKLLREQTCLVLTNMPAVWAALSLGLGLGISVKEVTGCNSVPHVSSHRLPRRTGVTHTQRERLHISRPHPLPRNQCNSVPHVSSHGLPRRTGVTHTQRERLHISRPHPLPRNQFRSKLTCPGGRDWNRGAGMSGLVSPSLLRVCVRG